MDSSFEVVCCDPHVNNYQNNIKDLYKAAEGSHLVILGVNHNEFSNIDFKRLKNVMSAPNLFDTRNFWNRQTAAEAGLKLYLLGSHDL